MSCNAFHYNYNHILLDYNIGVGNYKYISGLYAVKCIESFSMESDYYSPILLKINGGESMAKDIYGDFKKKLDRIENHLAEEVAPQANELLKESVRFSLVDWYNDYTPQSYERTYNFMKILDNTKTRGKRNVLSFVVDSGSMNSYSGFYGNSLQPSTALDFMFMNGEHGHDKKGFEGKHHWMMHRSLPPYMYVERDIESGFGGRLDKIVNNRIEEILRK